jgi:hypothetical protein
LPFHSGRYKTFGAPGISFTSKNLRSAARASLCDCHGRKAPFAKQ